MSSEPLHIFDPRRNMHVQGFSGRAATTTLHDATETGISISGIFQAAEDFAVLGLYNAYDYFSHLRLKHLPKTDLSSLTLEFDIEYDQTLDGAIRLDAAEFGSGTKAATGLVRLPNTGAVKWRKADDSGDLGMALNASDHVAMDATIDFAAGQTFGAFSYPDATTTSKG